MCGRYALALTSEAIAEAFSATPLLPDIAAWSARFNIAPTTSAPVVLAASEASSPTRELALLRWGLIPFWAKDASIGGRLANARGETLAERPAFREAWRRRRCLIPATAFYEWQATAGSGSGSSKGSPKQPFAIGMDDGSPLALGGIWERWRSPDGTSLRTFAIVTVEPNSLMRPIHDRMPLIVPGEAWDNWLASDHPPVSLLRPFPSSALRAWPVSRLVNSPRNDSGACLEAISPEG